jgi:hypothetical protein
MLMEAQAFSVKEMALKGAKTGAFSGFGADP